MTPGLVINPQGCTVTPVGQDAVTVQCGFSLSNTGTDILVVAVAAVTPAGGVLSIQPLEILPGSAPVSFLSPPSGATWLIAAQTKGHMEWTADWHLVLAIVVGLLAGLGLVGLIGAISFWSRW